MVFYNKSLKQNHTHLTVYLESLSTCPCVFLDLNTTNMLGHSLEMASFIKLRHKSRIATTACANYCGAPCCLDMLILIRRKTREPGKNPRSTGELNKNWFRSGDKHMFLSFSELFIVGLLYTNTGNLSLILILYIVRDNAGKG